jgi:hypothetical protein
MAQYYSHMAVIAQHYYFIPNSGVFQENHTAFRQFEDLYTTQQLFNQNTPLMNSRKIYRAKDPIILHIPGSREKKKITHEWWLRLVKVPGKIELVINGQAGIAFQHNLFSSYNAPQESNQCRSEKRKWATSDFTRCTTLSN